MRIYKTKNYDEMSRKAANIISAQMILKPESVLGLATGSSPIGTYKQLINWYKKGDLDFSQIHSINLDEYKGLDASNSESYAYFMRHNLFDHVNIKPENTYIPTFSFMYLRLPTRMHLPPTSVRLPRETSVTISPCVGIFAPCARP